MSDTEFTRRGILSTSMIVGGAALAGNARAATATPRLVQNAAEPETNTPAIDSKAGTEAGEKLGNGGEIHQVASSHGDVLTTSQGVPIADDQNSLTVGPRGPVLLEDFILLDKIRHFDHERIPERVVHARGVGAHGFFELTSSLSDVSRADLFQRVGEKTPVFVRFSTVGGNKGSMDVARDVRGFAVKFYTKQGNWDLVGNNMPVFFIQDAIKFPDLVHAVKEEPDRGFPQAQTAHDTFWDFASLTPEINHMIMWIMSDRAIPRSYRMMEGFGVHSFRLINDAGKTTYVKFHWRPKLGMQSVIWDEAVKINGADPDFHRRDLWTNIDSGNFPEWDLAVQLFDEDFAQKFDFDVLDATKLIPEEILPLRVVGRMVLNQNPSNVFAETEQVAFCTAHVVPGIDFTNDPLLQGRNFSYLDTQLKRLGGPNFAQIPINQASNSPAQNFQRDGHMQMSLQKGRVAYEPSALDDNALREDPRTGYRSFAARVQGDHMRARASSFADHYSQARMFFMSQTEPEQNHIIAALIFELSKVETKAVRGRMLGQLANVDPAIARRVADGLAYRDPIKAAATTKPVRTDLKASPALSILAKAKPTFETRKVGCLVSEGANAGTVDRLRAAVKQAGGELKIIAPKVGGVTSDKGEVIEADYQLAGGPSVLFDAVVLVIDPKGANALMAEAAAVAFVHDAFAHLKVIGHTEAAQGLMTMAGVKDDPGVVALGQNGAAAFVDAAKKGRIWTREPMLRPVP